MQLDVRELAELAGCFRRYSQFGSFDSLSMLTTINRRDW